MAEIHIERRRKSRAWPILLALVVLAIIAAGVWLFWVEPDREAATETETPAAAEQSEYPSVPSEPAPTQPYSLPEEP